ncbi:MAG: sulfatase-like hydrolase/transferase, partial [Phycisphaerales bacterium]
HMGYEPPPPFDTLFDPDYTGSLDGRYESLEKYIKDINADPKEISPRDLVHVTALYDGEIRYTDTQLRRIYDALGDADALDNTLFIVTGDHGEEHNDHGSMEGHGWTLYEEVVRVPLIMRLPRCAYGGRTVGEIIESIDIAPTILDIARSRKPDSFQGRSLLPLLSRRHAGSSEEPAFSISRRFGALKASVRDGRYKLIYTGDTGPNKWGISAVPGIELYDLTSDPGEQSNIAADSLPAGRRLMKALYEWFELAQTAGDEGDLGERVHFTPEELERLRSIGYIGFGDDVESSESPASASD